MNRGIAVALVVAATFLAGSTPASALSCAAPPADAPQIAAVNGEVFGAPFFDEYDFAVVATVTGIETDETPGSDTYGDTTIEADVALVLGDAEATETIQLSADDPGWMAGYAFRVGRSYFVPVDAVSPSGQVNHTFLCTPVTEVDDAEGTADRLAALAEDSGVAHASPGNTPPTTVEAPGEEDESSSSPFVALGTAVGVFLVATAIAMVARRRRRSDR